MTGPPNPTFEMGAGDPLSLGRSAGGPAQGTSRPKPVS